MTHRWAMALAVLAGLAFTATPARAVILNVGDNAKSPDTFATNPVTDAGNTVLATQTVSGTSSSLDVTVKEWVVKTTSGTLDFVYQVTNNTNSPNGIERFTVSNFGRGAVGTPGPWTLDTGYVTGTTNVIPDTVDRPSGSFGDVVGWNFINSIGVGKTSAILVVATNATTFTTGQVAVLDGTGVNLAGYQPGPEPSTLALAGVGALGLIGYGLRRRKTSDV